jgi:chemotaxis protein MotB
MSEKLLFKSGSTTVDEMGVKALVELAKALNSNADVDVMIEGHTDNVPMKSPNFPKDNWDLSVLRATSIVKILSSNSLDSKRIIASGRGEFFPLQDNVDAEGKRKNRRTEIILSPKFDQIMNLLEK